MPVVLVLGADELVAEVMDALADDSEYPLVRFTQDARESADWFVLCVRDSGFESPARTTPYIAGVTKLHQLLPAMVKAALGPGRPLLPVAREAMDTLTRRIIYHFAMLAGAFVIATCAAPNWPVLLLLMLVSLYHTARLAGYLACFTVPILECDLFQGPNGLLRRTFAAAL